MSEFPRILGKVPRRLQRKRGWQPPPPTERELSTPLRGWYACCGTFYVGFGWTKPPPCPKCGKTARQALMREVYEEHA